MTNIRNKKQQQLPQQQSTSHVLSLWRGLQMSPSGLCSGPPLCLLIPPPLSHRRHRLDCWVGAELHMSLLLLRDSHSRVGTGFDQSSHCCREVVHRADPLLEHTNTSVASASMHFSVSFFNVLIIFLLFAYCLRV